MPFVQTVEGYSFDIPQDVLDTGRFTQSLNRIGRNGIYQVAYDFILSPLDNQWRIDDDFLPDDRDPAEVDRHGLYDDDLEAPVFHGWEMIACPHDGKHGDLYVCIDPNMGRDYRNACSPELAKATGGYTVNPDFGDTKPGPGFRIYRKVKGLLGPVRLVPSASFSQPLPLP